MENDTKPRKPHWKTCIIFGVALMFINLFIANKMAAAPFSAFVAMVVLINAVLGLAFRTIYNTIMRNDSEKEGN
jgi:hypothetical protein